MTVLKRFALVPLLAATGLLNIIAQPAHSQALAPYVLQLDGDRLEQQGVFLFHSAIEAYQRGAYTAEQASTQVRLASQIAPNNPQILASLGGLYLRQGEFERALDVLSHARSLAPDNPAILFEIGTVYLRQENYRQAADALEQGLDISPNVFEALFDLGNAYYQLDQYDEAIASYEKAIEVQDDLWFAVNNIGLVLYEQNDREEAISYWEQAVEMTNKTEAEPLLALAVANYQAGEELVGIAQGVRALTLDTAYADLEFLRQNLWGDRLLEDTAEFLNLPRIQSTLAQIR
ncbi:MAG: tetratricopeptide repeat protein [Merismopedia sp. SIO2A8]|nr:tetratricopeptide repeat protein [Merismopedia sp. SIO2A8]